MKKLLFILTLAFVSISCNNDDDNTSDLEANIVGTWDLVATLADPGDGSGTFQSVSGKSLEFTTLGVVNCNISFCFGSLTQATSTGTYDIPNTSITADNCTGTYTFNGVFLEISHFCIEPCIERYVRVN